MYIYAFMYVHTSAKDAYIYTHIYPHYDTSLDISISIHLYIPEGANDEGGGPVPKEKLPEEEGGFVLNMEYELLLYKLLGFEFALFATIFDGFGNLFGSLILLL
jgi:hypothetical protein